MAPSVRVLQRVQPRAPKRTVRHDLIMAVCLIRNLLAMNPDHRGHAGPLVRSAHNDCTYCPDCLSCTVCDNVLKPDTELRWI